MQTTNLTEIEENLRKIEALSELYEEFSKLPVNDPAELKITKIKMKIARDEILELSLELKKQLQTREKELAAQHNQ